MKRKPILFIAALAAAALSAGAWYVLTRTGETPAPTASAVGAGAKKERKILYWTDPMIPGFKSDKPGKSPMGMDMVPVYEDGDETAGGEAVVTIRPEIVQNLGVRTYKVTRGAQPRRLVTTGFLFRDNRGMAVLVDLFDRDASLARPGQVAEIRIADAPGRTYHGAVESVESDIDIGARALKARIRMTHTDATLRPNMLAEVTIQASTPGKQALFIPREALIRTGSRTAVVLALGSGRFQPVEVVPGVEADDWVEIASGIKEGDTVVTSGQFLIDSEANVRATFKRMESNQNGKPGDASSTAPAAGQHTGH